MRECELCARVLLQSPPLPPIYGEQRAINYWVKERETRERTNQVQYRFDARHKSLTVVQFIAFRLFRRLQAMRTQIKLWPNLVDIIVFI